MTSSIVTTTYRYKPPPRKRKAVAIEAPAVVTAKSSRRPPVEGIEEEAAAEASEPPAITTTGRRAQPSTPREIEQVATPPANDDHKPSIVTVKRKSRLGDAHDLTPEEHQRRGEAADTLWRELVRRATAKRGV